MIKYIALSLFLVPVATPQLGIECDEFDEANVFIEINATDGDAGFQGIVDGEPWERLTLQGTDGRSLFRYKIDHEAREQGFTEFERVGKHQVPERRKEPKDVLVLPLGRRYRQA